MIQTLYSKYPIVFLSKKLDLILDGEKKIETYTKKDWADSYTGSILVFDGKEVVADKDISLKVTELEGKFQKNTLKIEDKSFLHKK